jgi:autotransporter-associated beta strand protein
MSGTGALIKSGGGTLTITGANSYSGGTRIDGGSLVGNTVSLQGAIVNNAQLVFDQTASGTYDGVVSGTGALTKSGNGALTLTGANTYSGGTTIDGGTLIGTSASLQGNIVNNALLTFDQTFSGTYAGAISGTGALTKSGSGALTLTGANSYAGGTTVAGGSLIGNTGSLRGGIISNAQLVFNQTTDGVFSGVFGGSGSVIKAGTGMMTLVGSHTIGGGLTVSQGTLVLDGTLDGNVAVLPGATFRTSGTVLGSVNVAGGLTADASLLPAASRQIRPIDQSGSHATGSGDLMPLQSILTIGGDLNAVGGSVLSFPVSDGPHPSILVGGQATLNGSSLDLTEADTGGLRSVSFLALTAARGLSIANTGVSTPNEWIIPALNQQASSLFVTLLNLNVPLALSTTNPNSTSVARAIDRLKFEVTGDGAAVVRELTALDDNALDDALQLIAGEIHASSVLFSAFDSQAFTDLLRDQVTDREHDRRDGQTGWGGDAVQWWTQFAGMHGKLGDRDGVRGGTVDLGGPAGGIDRRVSDRWLIGGGGGFGFGNMGLGGLGASADFQSPKAFGYVGFKPRGFGLLGGGSASRTMTQTKRPIVFAATLPPNLGGALLFEGIDREALGEETLLVSDVWSEYSDNVDIKSYTFDWKVGIRRVQFSRDGFVETNAGSLSLELPHQSINFKQTDVKLFVWRREGSWRPFGETTFRWEMTDGKTTTGLQFAGASASDFEVEGLPVPSNTFAARGGMTMMTRVGALTFEYRISHATGQTLQSVDLRLRFK